MCRYYLFALLLLTGRPAQARLGLPLVDLSTHVTNTAVSVPIWSATDVTMNAGNTLTVKFPSDWTVPASLAFSSNYVFTKYGMTQSAWAFTLAEVTITSGSISGSTVNLILPFSFAPGPFYVRFDDSAGFKTPVNAGQEILTLSYGGTTTESKPFTIGDGLTTMGQINGYAYWNVSGVNTPIQGGLVVADTDAASSFSTTTNFIGALPLWDLGPTATSASAKTVSNNRYSTVTGTDGRFTLQLPYNSSTTYYVAAYYYGATTTGAPVSSYQNWHSNLYTQVINASYTSPVSLTLTSFSATSNN